jgi:2-aminoadipate transaminase
VIEEPGYLGAIQAFSIYKSTFHPIAVNSDGIDLNSLEKKLSEDRIKLLYSVPNFQNPSGISYSEDNRNKVAEMLTGKDTIIIEDDPYGELRFLGTEKPSFKTLIPENTVLLGSFSKIVAPSLRIGWIVAADEIMAKLLIAKQASDLHTNYFGQRLIFQYLQDNNIDDHIETIKTAYGKQRDAMVTSIKDCFPGETEYTEPEGGMFLWITLPNSLPAMVVFHRAIEEKVAFVPGDPFYLNKANVNTLRLNFSSVDEKTIHLGIKRLGDVLTQII